MANSYQNFHSSHDGLRNRIHIVLVRPEVSGNVGAAARAAANMGIRGSFRIVGSPLIIDERARALAKHAQQKLDEALHFETLADALHVEGKRKLAIASTARVGSAHRPHPTRLREAMPRAIGKLIHQEIDELFLVFGPEGNGLENFEIALCDWIVTIPSSPDYHSLNLAQAILLFCYETNACFLEDWKEFRSAKPGQRDRLIGHFIQLAEASGFVLPHDPFKMKPRLEAIFSQLPRHIKDVETLHGLLGQAIRSLGAGHKEFKGRYKKVAEAQERLVADDGQRTEKN